jgi:8-oxo-dGTP pyrophosphatase MutT (NUDIX family)
MKLLFLLIVIICIVAALLFYRTISGSGGGVQNAFIFLVHDGKFLAVRDKNTNEWMLPGGKIDKGETPRKAAFREFEEETEYELKDDGRIQVLKEIMYNQGDVSINGKPPVSAMYIVSCRYNISDRICDTELFNNNETNNREWIPLDEYDTQHKKWRQVAWNSVKQTLVPIAKTLNLIRPARSKSMENVSAPNSKKTNATTMFNLPPDSEDESSEPEEEDHRPLCRYAPKCYQVNSQHKLNYRH